MRGRFPPLVPCPRQDCDSLVEPSNLCGQCRERRDRDGSEDFTRLGRFSLIYPTDPFAIINAMTSEVVPSLIGSRVRARRLASGTSLRRLAARALLTPAGLHQIENDRVSPTLRSATKIAACLDCSLDELTRPPALEQPPQKKGKR
jgi:DNA-binding XRE family transcriptional regulator